MTKQKKLDKLNDLIKQVHGGEPRDFRRVYQVGTALPDQLADFIYAADDYSSLLMQDIKHVPDIILCTAAADETEVWCTAAADETEVRCTEHELDELCIYRGRDILALLDKMKADLGPDPENAIVLWNQDDLHIVTVRDTTVKELDQYIDAMELELSDIQEVREARTARAKRDKAQRRVNQLVQELGAEYAADLLAAGSLKAKP